MPFIYFGYLVFETRFASDPIPTDRDGLWVNSAGELLYSQHGVAKRVILET